MVELDQCVVCVYAERHGHWGQEGTHCRKCHRSWRGLKETHCVSCCAHFSTHDACDKHLKPYDESGCYDPSTLTGWRELTWNEKRQLWQHPGEWTP
jgi:hypothetical protein